MLNKEQSKEYEKYLMKKKTELLEYLRRQVVNLGVVVTTTNSMETHCLQAVGSSLGNIKRRK